MSKKPTIWYIECFERILQNMKGCYITDAGYENIMQDIQQMKREVRDE